MRTRIISVLLVLVMILSNVSFVGLAAEGAGGFDRSSETINVTVTVIWDDADNQDGLRPDSVMVQLYANEEAFGDAVTLNESNNWNCAWELEKYDDNKEEVRYTVGETSGLEGYSSQLEGDPAAGFKITCYHEPETVDVNVSVVWDDENNLNCLRPENVVINLFADGIEIDNNSVSEADGWVCSFAGLPLYEDGNEIFYTVTEEEIQSYQTVITGNAEDGFVVTNLYQPTTYTVTYDLAGGVSTTGQLVYAGVRAGDVTPRIMEPTKEGWTFIGWEPAIADTVVEDVTYRAQWEQRIPEVKALVLDKQVDRVTANVGDVLTYTIRVLNAGNMPLENVVVVDAMLGRTENIALLDVGASMTFVYRDAVGVEDAGTTLQNTAIAWVDGEKAGEDSCTTWISDVDEDSYIPPVEAQLNREDHFAYIIGKDDGLVHPMEPITRAETATILFRLLTDASRQEYWSQENSYVDVSRSDWFNNAVSTLTNAGILTGRPEYRFAPADNITRGEFAALVVRFFLNEEAEVTKNYLTDIKGHWAEGEICSAYALGLVTGYPDATFRPEQEITRAEAMVIINRVLERYPNKNHLLEDMIVWPDNKDTEVWYYADVQEATNSHIYVMKTDKDGGKYEIWQQLLEVRDWAALEKEWSAYNFCENQVRSWT